MEKEDIQNVCDECCDNLDINNEYISHVFQWLIDSGYSICKPINKSNETI